LTLKSSNFIHVNYLNQLVDFYTGVLKCISEKNYFFDSHKIADLLFSKIFNVMSEWPFSKVTINISINLNENSRHKAMFKNLYSIFYESWIMIEKYFFIIFDTCWKQSWHRPDYRRTSKSSDDRTIIVQNWNI